MSPKSATNISAPKVSVPSPNGGYTRKPSPHAMCVGQVGDNDHVTGALLAQIKYRFNYGEALFQRPDGEKWIVQPRECWCVECGLTDKQLRRAMKKLETLGLIAIGYHHFHASGWPILAVRLIPDQGTECPEVGIHSGSGYPEVGKPCPPSGAASGSPSGQQVDAPKGTQCSPDGAHKGDTKKGTKTGNKNGILSPPAKKTNLEKGSKEDSGKKNKKEGGPAKAVETAWLYAHKLIYPDYKVTGFAGSDWHTAKAVVEKLGELAPAVVDAAIANWDDFMTEVCSAKGLFNQGDLPHLNKLVNHADIALNWWQKDKPASAKEGALSKSGLDGYGLTVDDEVEYKRLVALWNETWIAKISPDITMIDLTAVVTEFSNQEDVPLAGPFEHNGLRKILRTAVLRAFFGQQP